VGTTTGTTSAVAANSVAIGDHGPHDLLDKDLGGLLAHLTDNILALLIVSGLGGVLGLLGADLIIGGAALLVRDLPGHGAAVLGGGGLTLGIISGLILGLGALLAVLGVRSGALLGVDGLVLGGAHGATIAAGLSRGDGSKAEAEEDGDEELHFSWIV